MTARRERWEAAFTAAVARYYTVPTLAEARREVLLASASRVTTYPEANGELAALQWLHEERAS